MLSQEIAGKGKQVAGMENNFIFDLKFFRKKDIVAANLEGEVVTMNLMTGKYYNLGKTGSVIWSMLEEPVTVDELVQKLMEKYQVSRNLCEKDVMDFLKTLLEEGLIDIA